MYVCPMQFSCLRMVMITINKKKINRRLQQEFLAMIDFGFFYSSSYHIIFKIIDKSRFSYHNNEKKNCDSIELMDQYRSEISKKKKFICKNPEVKYKKIITIKERAKIIIKLM